MNILNIMIILTFIELNECSEIEKLKKEMNNLKQDFNYLGSEMLKRITEFEQIDSWLDQKEIKIK